MNADNRLEMVWFEGLQMPEKLSLDDLESDDTDMDEDGSDDEDDALEQNLSSDEEELDDDYE